MNFPDKVIPSAQQYFITRPVTLFAQKIQIPLFESEQYLFNIEHFL